MPRTIIVSNRLPVTVTLGEGEEPPVISESLGGLATGLKSVHEQDDSLWIGWSGLLNKDMTGNLRKEVDAQLVQRSCLPVYLSENQVDAFYYGFCNKTIWPLFHYFPNKTEWQQSLWESYREVNEIFSNELAKVLKPGDHVWVHDYQLMLLPAMIRERFPEVNIGFFLHIPFPSYEIFRLLPWREEVLRGILGADLVGFHTYDYVRHFLSSARRLLGYENSFGKIILDGRTALADAFPMGIDYKRYNQSGQCKAVAEGTSDLLKEIHGKQIILSVDRLDYTKGLPERIRAFGKFLEENPGYLGKVHLIVIAAPSRIKVDSYIELEREVEELVSQINGRHGKIGWVPIWFFFKPFSFEELSALYRCSDVLLVTPLRDGMNLVVKEYIASRTDLRGTVVLSETAGAASELGEALLVNPNDIRAIARAIKEALEVPVVTQIEKNQSMHARLARYNVDRWAQDFMRKLADVAQNQPARKCRWLGEKDHKGMLKNYASSKKRLLIFDYDGTLTPLRRLPELAAPTEDQFSRLRKLAKDPKNQVLVISGRKKNELHDWFSDLPVTLIAEHGLWQRELGGKWETAIPIRDEWKEEVRSVIEFYVDRTPGSFVEEKTLGMAWHYRRCEPELATVRLNELRDTLISYINNLNLCLLDGNKVLEIRDVNANKGFIVENWLDRESWDFVFCAGDDVTDEDMFEVLPEDSYTVKIGFEQSKAAYHIKSSVDLLGVVDDFLKQ
ncbi:bifunctional alpha,alpha-trehalose-phosphate synthase (UDP-forming)/trehalose-phosphatase [bacterium M21]|nr:bifunctional alpha,alpha-trehalose-phosphate synthase (UDP-forming)/trehalose-phosphatase [bacterium M21]